MSVWPCKHANNQITLETFTNDYRHVPTMIWKRNTFQKRATACSNSSFILHTPPAFRYDSLKRQTIASLQVQGVKRSQLSLATRSAKNQKIPKLHKKISHAEAFSRNRKPTVASTPRICNLKSRFDTIVIAKREARSNMTLSENVQTDQQTPEWHSIASLDLCAIIQLFFN